MPLMAALGPDDKIATHHRNHGHVLARGADPKLALAEILGRENGFNRGAGGHDAHERHRPRLHLHLGDRRAAASAWRTGAGFALKSQGRRRGRRRPVRRRRARGGRLVRVAQPRRALYSLPVVYVCENNSEGALGSAGGGFPTSVSAVDDLTDIPQTFGIPVETVDGRDVDAVFDVVEPRGRAHPRAQGAVLHPRGDRALRRHASRSGRRCPTGRDRHLDGVGRLRHARASTSSGSASTTRCCATRASCSPRATSTRTSLTELDARVRERIAEARQFALDSPRPTPESALDHVFA